MAECVHYRTLMEQPDEILKRLIAVPSVNPEDTADPAITGEARLADLLARDLAARGLRVTCEEVAPGRPNFIAESAPDQGQPTLLIEVHLDTVSVAGMSIDPFTPVEREGRIYGRGACDDKGPMAAALAALTPERVAALDAAGIRLVFVGAMGEEKGNQGAKDLVRRNTVRADQILVLEPTELAVVHAHKGILWAAFELHGRAVHGSEPERGVSAIEAAISFVTFWKEETARAREALGHDPLLGGPTVNVGRIEGGTQVNIVPALCRLQVDRRLVPGERAEDLFAGMQAFLGRLVEAGQLVGFEARAVQQGDPFATAPDCRLVRRFEAALDACGLPAQRAGAAWYSDAGPLAALCPEVIVFGPGSIRQAHTADEFIEVASLRAGTRVLGEWLDRTAREGL